MSIAFSRQTFFSDRYRKYVNRSSIAERLGKGFLRVYFNIIASTWSILILLPIENIFVCLVCPRENISYRSSNYYYILASFTAFFFLSYPILPIINKYIIKRNLRVQMHDYNINSCKKKSLLKEIISMPCYSSIISKVGFLKFTILILSNLMFAALFFGVENIVSLLQSGNFVFTDKLYGNVNFAAAICDFLLSVTFCCLWLISRKRYNLLYSKKYLSRIDRSYYEERVITDLCSIASLYGMDGDGMGSISLKESMETTLKLLKVYHSEESEGNHSSSNKETSLTNNDQRLAGKQSIC